MGDAITATIACHLCGGPVTMLTSSVNHAGSEGKAVVACGECGAEMLLEVRLTVTRRPIPQPRGRASTRELYWPLEPIERRLPPPEGDGHPVRTLPDVLGITRRSLITLRHRGGLSTTQADRVALSLECHPVDLWPDWYERLGMSECTTMEAAR